MDEQEYAPPQDAQQATNQHGDRPPRREQRQRRPDRREPDGPSAGAGQQGGRPPRKSGPGGGQNDGRDGRKRRRDGGDRRPMMAFGDTIERAVCTSYRRWEPETFPIQHRTGLATRRIIEVDRRSEATLFCDGAHAGPCIWPDGELVFLDEPDSIPIAPSPVASETLDVDELTHDQDAIQRSDEPAVDPESNVADQDVPTHAESDESPEQDRSEEDFSKE